MTGRKIELAPGQLAVLAAFVIVTDEQLTVTWASEPVLRRVDDIVGVRVSKALRPKDAGELTVSFIQKNQGKDLRLMLGSGGQPLALRGVWLDTNRGWTLLAWPDVKTQDDLDQFSLDDFTPFDSTMELLTIKEEHHTSMSEARRFAKATRRSQERFRDIAESMGDWIWEVDEQGRYTFCSDRVRDILGYEPEEMKGKTPFELMDEQEAERVGRIFSALLRERKPIVNLENCCISKRGEKVFLLTNGVAYFEDDGQFAGYRGVDSDITEEKKKQAEIQSSELKFRTLYEASSDAVMLLDEKGFFDCNKATLEMFGCESAEEFCSCHPADLSPPVQPCGTDSMTLANEMIGTAMQKGSHRFELVHRRYDSKEDFSAEVLLNSLELEGRKVLQAVVRDISERKKIEMDLQQIRLAVDASGNGIVIGSVDGKIFYVNDMFRRMFGYDLEDFKTIHPAQLYKDRKASKEIFGALRSGEGWQGSVEMKTKQGQLVPIRINADSVKNSKGEVVSIIGVHTDISEQVRMMERLKAANEQLEQETARAEKMAAEAERASAAKSEFLANMSHEIRTPMNGVIGMIGLLLETELSDEQRHYADTVRVSAEALLGLLNDILDFSKIEAGKLDLEMIDFNLRSMLDDFASSMEIRMEEKRLEFICAADPDVPSMLRGDPGRLRQVLVNLMGNAIKFTSDGEIAVRVGLEKETDDEVKLRFSVKDTGIGIAEDKLDHMFDKFTQADSSTTRKYGGTGLGLAISKQLAELMGGEIGANSRPGKGSEFWFTVRMEKSSLQEEPGDIPSVDLDNIRVLVVDDNATNREVLMAQLGSWGMRPVDAEDGPLALQKLYSGLEDGDPFRLVLTDMQMPGMDGEALGRIVLNEKKFSGTALVMMTSLGDRGDAKRFEQLGFAAYLMKPVRQSDLFDCLCKIVSGHGVEKKKKLITRHSLRDFRKTNIRILLAEDNITNQQVALGILRKLGLSADVAADGKKALDALKKEKYDLVFMDVQMPNMDGIEATKAIRAGGDDFENAAVPIIAMTAHAMQGDRQMCLDAGMDDYITKPVTPAALSEMLEKWTGGLEEKEKDDVTDSSEVEKKTGADQTSSERIFVESAIVDRLMGDKDIARVIVQGFLDDMPRQIQELEDLLHKKDCAAVSRCAHTIKGASANVGAEALREVAYEMEMAGKAGESQALSDAFPRLGEEFRRLVETVRSSSLMGGQ